MAVRDNINGSKGVRTTHEVDTIAGDLASLDAGTFFRTAEDNYTMPYIKTEAGNAIPAINNTITWSASFNTVTEVEDVIPDNTIIESITPSAGVASYLVSINGGEFGAPPALPWTVSAGTVLIWQIVYDGGATLASITIKGTI